MNTVKEDILPTGEGIGSLTAHPTTVELDPDATGVSLRVTYIMKHEVDDVLYVAEKIRQYKVQALNGHDDVPELEGVDLSYKAHQACAILNIQTSGGGDGIEKIRNHEGVFELPETKYSLLGRVRTLHVAAPTGTAMLKQLNEWLVLHTVGSWSHFGIVRDVTCVLPSKPGMRLTVYDVPGCGHEASNPFRQGLVRDALKHCEASTLLVCLDWRRIDGRNNESRPMLQDAGVYEELFGDPLQRKIGQVV